MPINYSVEYPKLQRTVWELREEVQRLRGDYHTLRNQAEDAQQEVERLRERWDNITAVEARAKQLRNEAWGIKAQEDGDDTT